QALGTAMAAFVRRASPEDVEKISSIHREAFPRQLDSEAWVGATLAAAPRMFVHVVLQDDDLAGYIFWAQKSGFRSTAVLELDQVAVRSELRGKGLGELLIKDSLSQVEGELVASGQSIKSILVSTRADNHAQRLYAKVLGARVVAEIDGLYSAAEVFMLAENAVPNNSFKPTPLRGAA
ncbi:N-acetyltransferase family protein, partial [Luteimonas sp. A534]